MRLTILPTRRAAATIPALLAALLLGACADAAPPTEPPPPEPPPPAPVRVTAQGQVLTLDGALPPGLQVIIAAAGQRTTAAVSGDGTFSIVADVPPGSYDVILDADGPARTTLPALVRRNTATGWGTLRVLLVPSRWGVTAGTYAGSAPVPISLEAAFKPPCTTAGDTNCDGFYPAVWSSGMKLWPPHALPLRVAFDHANSTDPISATDSIAFWTILDRMTADFGTALFRPATLDQITLNNDIPDQAIVVRVDNTLSGFGAWTNWWWNGAGELYAARVRPRTPALMANSSLMSHEMLHTLGFKHSCSWTTVMAGYAGCVSAARLSVHDVAYAQLATQIDVAQRATGATHALIAARNAERVLSLGLPPLPAVAASALRSGGSDNAH